MEKSLDFAVFFSGTFAEERKWNIYFGLPTEGQSKSILPNVN